jgi:hypothetical protein
MKTRTRLPPPPRHHPLRPPKKRYAFMIIFMYFPLAYTHTSYRNSQPHPQPPKPLSHGTPARPPAQEALIASTSSPLRQVSREATRAPSWLTRRAQAQPHQQLEQRRRRSRMTTTTTTRMRTKRMMMTKRIPTAIGSEYMYQ